MSTRTPLSPAALVAAAALALAAGAQDATVPLDHDTIGEAVRLTQDADGNGQIEILVLPGIYRENVRIWRSGVRLMSMDSQITFIEGNGHDDVVRVAPPAGVATLQDVNVSGFTIRGGGSGGEGVEFYRVTGGGVVDCFIEGCHEGVLVDDSTGIAISDNSVSGNGGNGIRVVRSRAPFVFDNSVFDNGGQGIYLADVIVPLAGYDTRFEMNVVTGNGENGLLALRTTDLTVYECVFEENRESGIRLKETLEAQVIGCGVFRNGADGLRMESTTDSFVSENVLFDNAAYGIRMRVCWDDDFAAAAGIQEPAGDNLIEGNGKGAMSIRH